MAITFPPLCIMLSSLIVMTMSSPSSHLPLIKEYNKTCFVPPSARPNAEDTLFLLGISLPNFDEGSIEYITFPFGTCGLDVYVLFPDYYLEPLYKPYIEEEANNFWRYCTISNDSSEVQMQIKFLTSGTGQSFVPDEQLSRLPTDWITRGIVLLNHIDYISIGRHVILCNIPFFFNFDEIKYNCNVSLQVNGCPSGRYGGSCENNCSCAEGLDCHSFNGACMCPAGLQGPHCNQSNQEVTVDYHHAFIPYGEIFKLTCTAHGMPQLTAWSWTKDGQATPIQSTYKEEEVSYRPRPIVITAILVASDTSVNGDYVCEIRDGSGEIYTQEVEVTVIAIPNPILEVPQSHSALAGTSTSFTCKTKSEAGRVCWVKGRNQPSDSVAVIQDSVGRYALKQPSKGVSELHIYDVEFSDEDVYRCFVGFTFQARDLNYVEAALTVQSDPLPICSFRDVVAAPSGEILTLRCLIRRAKPVPALSWDVGGGQITPEPQTTTFTKLSEDGVSWNISTSVSFVPVPEDNGKALSLILKSPAWIGSRKMETTLNITYAPLVTITPDPITLTLGQDASISCSAEANPEPNKITWLVSYPNRQTKQPITQGPRYIIRNADMKYNQASLTCIVGNSVGKMEKTSRIKVVADQILSWAAKIALSISGVFCLLVILLIVILTRYYRKEILLWWAKKAQKAKDDKEFDVFISYKSSSADEEFVIGNLIPRLEQDGYSVCVHYRHFMPGKSIIDNISEAVHHSRKTLLLLSPGFIESEWCRYEFQAALSEMLHLQTDLIPVIFGDLGPMDSLSHDLQTMLRTLSYVTWPGAVQGSQYRTEDEERFWALLWQALPPNPLGRQEPTAESHLKLTCQAEEESSVDSRLVGDRVPIIS